MHIYLCNRENADVEEKNLRRFCMEYVTHRELDSSVRILLEDAKLKTTPMGKPYFEGLDNLYFSISHSGKVWACAIDRESIGFDIEDLKKKRSYVNLANRFYTEEERDYVLKRGKEAFLKIWVRKEACLKYKGTGLSGGLSSIEIVHKDKLICDLSDCWVEGISIDYQLVTAYCSRHKRQIEKIVDCRR